ncbi:hypothetical protein HGRIS_007882 [Hohenbuehelia grisea]|uniref:Uncharacterized protein n=1 Tax=Hohenbuehelia grisea TaxID=104357 RepID=A0ABR3J6M7_9AGAR
MQLSQPFFAILLSFASNVYFVNAAAGVTTFNDYGSQSAVACSGFLSNLASNSQGNGIFAAALSDISPLWTGARCSGSKDASKCRLDEVTDAAPVLIALVLHAQANSSADIALTFDVSLEDWTRLAWER